MEKKRVSNIELYEDHVLLTINPKMYTLDVVYSAAYTLLDKAYVVLDGDPKHEILVEIKSKGEKELMQLAHDFNNELLNYAVYKTQSEKNERIRQAIIQRALLTNGFDSDSSFEGDLDDPEGIAVPWEEKYGE